MIKVKRTKIPKSLQVNEATWKSELLYQIKLKGEYSKVTSTYKERYKQDDIKEALEKMYSEKCCYCETIIGIASYEHIEHLRPKGLKQFHHLSFDWDNLHWSCQICNNKKRDQWNEQAPILDPCTDDPEQHIDFDLSTCKAVEKDGSERGKTTISHVDLNREKLVRARKRVKDRAMKYIVQIKKTESTLDDEFYKKELRNMLKGDPNTGDIAEYSMLIKKMVETYL
ncbi:retron system putative HNH endonuclease [Bacillus benzoevorans]|nr:retron system putative HNH endonuclease [Bacillus benzoevorans]